MRKVERSDRQREDGDGKRQGMKVLVKRGSRI